MNPVVARDSTAPKAAEHHPTLRVDIENLHGATHGDVVLARVLRNTPKGFEGEVVKVVEHAVERVVGRFESGRGHQHVVPFDRRFFQNVHASRPDPSLGVRDGDMVVLKITRRGASDRPAAGDVVERLGPMDEPGVDLKVILAQYELVAEFPEDVDRETEALAKPLADDDPEIRSRTDFRSWITLTIDPATAKDHDDAIGIEVLANGNYLLAVHIADVAHYVREGTALDASAYERGNSVYFPGFVVPMLPHALSSRICSLVEGENRLVQTAIMEVDAEGRVVRHEFHDGVIRSAAKVSYQEAQAILDGDAPTRERFSRVVRSVEQCATLAKILNAARVKRGSLDFDLPEPILELDENGAVAGINATERLFAMRMIEEFMLLANETVAQALDEKKVATLYRIHEAPDPDRVEEFIDAVKSFGLRVPDLENLTPLDFQAILRRVAGKPEERLVSYLLLRTQRLARYAPEDLGHFGLATSHYLHFTSPIRRYPDLVAHRALRAMRRSERAAAAQWPLDDMAAHLGETERRAADAERDLVEWKKARYMATRVGETYSGAIVGVQPFGLFVQLDDVFVEGLVHVATMADDFYVFRDTDRALRGENSRRVYKLGQKLEAQITKVDLDKRQIHLALTDVIARLESNRPKSPAHRAGALKPRPHETRSKGRNSSRRNSR